MRYEINLASRPYVDARQFYRQWGIALGGMALLTLVLGIMAFQRWSGSREIDREIQDLQHQTESLRTQNAANQKILDDDQNRPVREQARFLNAVILRKSYSWTRVLSELERLMPAQVHLTAMEPQVTRSGQAEIHMKIGATSHEKALDFVRALEKSGEFREVRVLDEAADESAQAKPADRIKMDVSAIDAPSATSSTQELVETGGAR